MFLYGVMKQNLKILYNDVHIAYKINQFLKIDIT